MKIELYTKDGCSYCTRAKDLLQHRKMPYTEIPMGGAVNKELVQQRAGEGARVNTVPQIFIDDKHIGGYMELVEYLAKNV